MVDNPLGSPSSYFSSPSVTTSLLDQSEQPLLNFPGDPRGTSAGRHDFGADIPNSYDHFCYICENPKPIRRCGDFIRHLKKHCEEYYCIPENAVKDTEDGPRCSACDMPDPDPKHLSNHNPPKCVGRHFSRMDTLVEHRKRYHPKNPQDIDNYSTLAEKSRYTGGRKKFACGFCVSGFGSLDEQVGHVHKAHYHRSMPPTGYDINKVILGLLSMNKHWQKLRTDNPSLKDSSFMWNSALAKKLQLKLEMSEESANDLYRAAFDNCNYGTNENSYVESFSGTNPTDPQMETNQAMQWFQASQSLLPRPSSFYQVSTANHETQLLRPPGQQWPSTVQHHVAWNNVDYTGVYGDQGMNPTTFENDEAYTSQYNYPFSGAPSQPAQTWASPSGLSYDSGSYGPPLGVSSNFTTSTSSRQGANALTNLEQAQTQGLVPTMESQPWNSLPNHPVSPVEQVNSSFAIANPMQYSRHHSQQSERHNCGNLDDSSNSNMQRDIQDNGDTRRRRRRH